MRSSAIPFRPIRVRRVSKHELSSIEQTRGRSSRSSSSSTQRQDQIPSHIDRYSRLHASTASTRPNSFDFIRSKQTENGSFNDIKTISSRIPLGKVKWPSDRSRIQFPSANLGRLNNIGETKSTHKEQDRSRRKSSKLCTRRCICCLLCSCIIVLLLLGAIAGLLVALLLRTTVNPTVPTTVTTATTSTSTTATTSTSTTSTTSTTSSTSVTTTSVTTTTTSVTSTTSRTTATITTTSTTSATTTSQSTTVVTRTLPALMCTTYYGIGNLYAQFTATPSSWTQVSRSYIANYTDPLLVFGVQTSSPDYHYFDNVSVVDVANPSVQLLSNPGFDNSTTTITDWDQWCSSSCNNGNNAAGTLVTGYPCGALPNECFQTCCVSAGAGIYFFGQKFSAILGHTYTISFWQIHLGSTSGNQLYVDIL